LSALASYALDWASLLVRWFHFIAGVAWIGASFYFIWLDDHLVPPEDEALAAKGVGGELWAVHGGGFYNPQKYRTAPTKVPAVLHWFKWEAYTTLLSGLLLMAIVYYANPQAYLVDPAVMQLSSPAAIGIGIATLVVGWLFYDILCRSPLGRNEGALTAVVAILSAAAAFGLCHVFSGRGAFLHFGAMLGTIMVLNVFFVIIPGQKAMVAAAAAGRPVDPIHGLRGKQRSVHNTYFTLPVLFAMISNHSAFLYGARLNWLVLIAIAFAGALIRLFFVKRHKARAPAWPLVVAALLLVGVAVSLAPSMTPRSGATTAAQAQGIVQARCVPCHSATPTFAGFDVAPKGLVLDTPAQVATNAPRIREQVASRAMPIGNLTHMTDAERQQLLDALAAEAAK
jgi:uncharacterized membrane protein